MKRMLFSLISALVAGLAHGQVVISEIDLAANKVELINTGTTTVNLSGYYWCNRLNGSPFYPAVNAATIDAANSDTTTLLIGPGQLVTFTLTAGFITDASGEVGLYVNNSGFGNSANIRDYVGWGANGVRDSTAASVGMWVSGTFVTVSSIQPGETIQLKQGLPGNSIGDYELAASTIGVDQVTPPAPVDLVVTDVVRSGTDLIVSFTGPSDVSPGSWQVDGTTDPAGFPDDRTSDTTVVETPASSGIYEATIDLSSAGPLYFVRIVLPE